MNYETAIADLIRTKFDIKQMRSPMYHSENLYYRIPSLLFFLHNNEHEESDYKKIEHCVDRFTGILKWKFGRAYPSKLNYVIIPEAAYHVKKESPDEISIQFIDKGNEVGGYDFKSFCDLAVQDIPALFEHMSSCLK